MLKKNELSSHEKHGKHLGAYYKGKEVYLKDSNYMMFWKRKNYRNKKKINGCQIRGDRGDKRINRHITEDF